MCKAQIALRVVTGLPVASIGTVGKRFRMRVVLVTAAFSAVLFSVGVPVKAGDDAKPDRRDDVAPESKISEAESKKLIEEIRNSWRDRMKRTKSVRVKWTTHVQESKLSQLAIDDLGQPAKLEPKAIERLAKEIVEWDEQSYFSTDGSRMRIELTSEPPRDQVLLRPADIRCAFDGKFTTMYDPKPRFRKEPILKATPGNDCSMLFDFGTQPIVWGYLPLSTKPRGVELETLRVIDTTTELEGRPHWVLRSDVNPSGRRVVYWIDPARGYTVTRYSIFSRGARHGQIDCTYEARDSIGWMPASWTSTNFDKGDRPLRTAVSVVTEDSVNPSFPDDEFTIKSDEPGKAAGDPDLPSATNK